MTNKEALQALLDGKKIRRESWNKGEYIYFDTDVGYIRDNDHNHSEFCCSCPNWEIYKEPKSILDDEEKAYLSAVIKPFKKRVINIEKRKIYDFNGKSYYDIQIRINSLYYDLPEYLVFPIFAKDSNMYKGMEDFKEYTLKELGLL